MVLALRFVEVGRFCPYLPAGGSQLRDTTALSNHALLIFQAPADDASGDREVLVVAVLLCVSKTSSASMQRRPAVSGPIER